MKTTSTTFISIICISLLFSSCKKEDPIVSGNGISSTKTLQIAPITGIDTKIFVDTVIIQHGATQQIQAVGDSNILSKITTEIIENKWQIAFKPGTTYINYKIKIYITLPQITYAYNHADGIINIGRFTNQSQLSIGVIGNGKLWMTLFDGATKLDATLKGDGEILCNNDVPSMKKIDILVEGSGSYRGFNLSGEEVTATLKGWGMIETKASNKLHIEIIGDGGVYYKGSPEMTKNISGYGVIVHE